MRLLLLACIGGALGSGARYLVNVGAGRLFQTSLPVATLTVNIVGGFLMGVLIETLALRYQGSPELRTFFATGILGGFTTFSAFSLEVVQFMQRGETGLAASYVAASVMLSVLALMGGLALPRLVFA